MENARAIFNLPLQIRPPEEIVRDTYSREFSQPSRQLAPSRSNGEGERLGWLSVTRLLQQRQQELKVRT